MPYQLFNAEEVAEYLHVSKPDLEKLVRNQEIPFEKRGGRMVFARETIDAWASQRILGFSERRLNEYHQKSTRGTAEIFPDQALMPIMIKPEYIATAMTSKTKSSLIRDMVELADKTGQVSNSKDLLESLEAREELCSTAIPGGLALLHARHQQAYLIESSFLLLGRTMHEVFYGSPDGQGTDLFFLVCCQDDRIHLHTLARICLIAMETELLPQLRQAADAQAMYDVLVACEAEVLAKKTEGKDRRA
jgi:nitrogen PTS system EIIA component